MYLWSIIASPICTSGKNRKSISAWPGSCHFVVFPFDAQAAVAHDIDHVIANVPLGILGGNGEVAFLMADLVAEVREFLAAGIPNPFVGIDKVKTRIGCLAEANVIENKEFCFGTKICRIG